MTETSLGSRLGSRLSLQPAQALLSTVDETSLIEWVQQVSVGPVSADLKLRHVAERNGQTRLEMETNLSFAGNVAGHEQPEETLGQRLLTWK